MIEAANRFDVSKGYTFITYAWHWIRQKIVRSAIDMGYIIRIPVHFFEKLIKVNNCRKRHYDASFEELLEYLNIEEGMELTPGKLDELIVYSDLYMNTSSLNDVIGEDGETECIEFVPDESVGVEDFIIGNHLKEDIRTVLNTLPERERTIIELRYGLNDDCGRTLEEISAIYGVTRERIRQIEAKALRKLRHPSRSRKLEEYI